MRACRNLDPVHHPEPGRRRSFDVEQIGVVRIEYADISERETVTSQYPFLTL